MKAEKRVITVATTAGNTTTVEAQCYGPLALYRFSKAFGLRPGPVDFQVAQVPTGIMLATFRKAETAKEYIAYLLAEMPDALVSERTMVAAGHRILAARREFFRRDFKPFPIPEEK